MMMLWHRWSHKILNQIELLANILLSLFFFSLSCLLFSLYFYFYFLAWFFVCLFLWSLKFHGEWVVGSVSRVSRPIKVGVIEIQRSPGEMASNGTFLINQNNR